MADMNLVSAANSVSWDARKIANESNDPNVKKLASALEELADALTAFAQRA